ncbi:MAG: hypothetical protein A3F73_11170 [Gallionellales bacterium RIFCSPLOWO2_12_FULL_59_22]|nr:MAG: hypothetical protein A3F73_11170 [Gallionellales bacterium RIFCSPLOWO2_12_FULL_59_22]
MKPPRYFYLLAAGLALCLGVGTSALAETGTAAQYFTQKAVGNNWTYLSSSTCSGTGCPPEGHAPATYVSNITAITGGTVTRQDVYGGYAYTSTEQIDATGAWTLIESDTYSHGAETVLPATFTVGTSWVPYTYTGTTPGYEGESGVTNTVAAFNVTRTVPAGTFTDCLQVNWVYSATFPDGTSNVSGTYYMSPAAGAIVESNLSSASSYAGQTMIWTETEQLQSYSIANAGTALQTLSVARSGTGTGTVTSSPAGINCGAVCSSSFTGGASVTLTATPASGSYFSDWSGDCAGAGSCVVTMDAAKGITATFNLVPFVATTISDITPTSATIATTVAFNTPDVGKLGEVYITAWVPSNGLGALGILAASLNQAMSVTTTRDNPYTGGKIDTRQEALGAFIEAADPDTFVLVQLTSTGWQLVQNGQLIPYATGVLGDSMSALSILDNTNPANLLGAQFCVGYGTSDTEMIASGRMMPVAVIPDATGSAATSGSCNVAAGVEATEFYKADIDHYFMTSYPDEALALDNKPEWNWVRTGKTFNVWQSQASAPSNASPVCRFFGVFANGTMGSHFYTVDPVECEIVKGRLDWGWGYEGDAFYAVKPTGGACPDGTSPVYRAYNNGMGGAPNHRYMTTQAELAAMVAQGWVSEGTAFCGVE